MKPRLILVAVAAMATSGSAVAQAPVATSPLLQHYRAYTAALEQGDVATAEAEAAAALAASVERYGDGGRTAVFALNLAGVRLVQGKYEAAIEPAGKALALAEAQGEASGVNPAVARLILGRAELRTGGDAAVGRLVEALEQAAGAPDLAGEAYPAAVELAVYSFEQERFDTARLAWNASTQFAAGSTQSAELVRATALTGAAAAGIMSIVRKAPREQLGTRIPVVDDAILQFDPILIEAMLTIRDQAIDASPDGRLTRAQGVWAQAYAWQMALTAKLRSEHRELPPRESNAHMVPEIRAAGESGAACHVRVIAEPEPRMPPVAQMRGGIGSVVLRLTVDGAGDLADVDVAASVGGPAFVESIMSVARQWRVAKLDSSPAGCRMAQQRFQGIEYAYR